MINTLRSLVISYSPEIFSICFILIGSLLTTAAIDIVFRRILMRNAPSKRAKTVLEVILNVLKAILFAIAVVLILSALHLNIMPILASAGIIGLAIGFGSQVLIKDIISGIFFIFENQFNAGDVVKVGTVEGTVEHVGLRTISVRDRDTGALHIIPNGSVTQVTNLSNNYSCVNVPFILPAKNDIDKVVKVLEKTAKEVEGLEQFIDIISHPIKVYALDDLSDGKMTLRAVIKTHPNRQEAVAQYFRYTAKKNFDKEKIILA